MSQKKLILLNMIWFNEIFQIIRVVAYSVIIFLARFEVISGLATAVILFVCAVVETIMFALTDNDRINPFKFKD